MAKKKKNVPGQGTNLRSLRFDGYMPADTQTFDRLYDSYKSKYNSAKGKLRAGQKMYLGMRTRGEFDEYFQSVVNQMKKDGDLPANVPEADLANRIITRMVNEDQYEYNKKQASALKKGLAKIDVEADELSIREGKFRNDIDRLEDYLSDYNKQLIKDGIEDGYKRAHIIGVEFFGSPE